MNLVNQKTVRRLWVAALTLSAVVLMPLSLGACASAQEQRSTRAEDPVEKSPEDSKEAQTLRQASASMWREQYFLMNRGGSGRSQR